MRIASGAIFTQGGFFDEEGDAIGAKFSPKFISSLLPDGLSRSTTSRATRRAAQTKPRSTKAAAEEAGLELGDTIQIVGRIPAKNYRLVGITKLGSTSFGGSASPS